MEQTNKKRALGRGLEELFSNEPMEYNKLEEKIYSQTPAEEITNVAIDQLRSNPYQPRKTFDEEALKELASSIKEHGVIQPIIVKKSIKGFEIVAGERRVKASKLLNKETIPAIVRDFTDTEMMEIALLENLQREDLNPLEEAEAYQRLLTNLNLTQEQLARRVGKSRSHITNILGILSLSNQVKNLIKENKLTMSHARAISKLEDVNEQNKLAQAIINNDLSVRDIEEITKPKNKSKQEKIVEYSEYEFYQEKLIEKLGTKVKIKPNKVEITYTNKKDLERILNIIEID